MSEQVFTFSSGLTVGLKRVCPVWMNKVRLAARNKHVGEHGEPKLPTYEIKSAAGVAEVYPHTNETIKDETDEAVLEAWAEYQAADYVLRVAEMQATVKAHVIRGVADEPPDEWRGECEYWGIPVPDDPRDAKFEWVWEQVTGYDELVQLSLAIQGLPDPVEEAARAAADSFPGPVEAPGDGSDAGADQGEAE